MRQVKRAALVPAVAALIALSPVRAGAGGTVESQRRVSALGPDGVSSFDATVAGAAAAPRDGEYLVVWIGDDDAGGLVEGELEVFGQRIDAADGSELGADDFRISRMGPDADTAYGPERCTPLEIDPDCGPVVAYAPEDAVYLVVWSSDDASGGVVEGEYEIFARRVASRTGAVLDADDVRLGSAGPAGNAAYDAFEPAVAYGAAAREFLVVWTAPRLVDLVDPELEIYGRRVSSATGAPLGPGEFRVSFQGPSGDDSEDFDAGQPAVAYAPAHDEFFVVWHGDDDAGDLVRRELEIYGRRVAPDGTLLGSQLRLTTFGVEGDRDLDAERPALAHDPVADTYLLAWQGTNEDLPEEASEIHVQLLDAADLSPLGASFAVSDMGGPGDLLRSATWPAVAYEPVTAEFRLSWIGDDDRAGLANEEREVFGQRLSAQAVEVGVDDFRVSAMGPDGSADYEATRPALAVDTTRGDVLIAWTGDDDTGDLVDGELEAWAARAVGSAIFVDGFETGDDAAWGDALTPRSPGSAAAP